MTLWDLLTHKPHLYKKHYRAGCGRKLPHTTIRVRIHNIDSYQAKNFPVIRIYGKDTEGVATCVHIHDCFPYFYVLYEPRVPQTAASVHEYCKRLHNAMDTALSVAFKRQTPFIHAVTATEGTSIYGYRNSPQTFLKIELTNHVFVHKLADMLVNGLGIDKLQPFEAHIPYMLHFMADYNLSGCGWIKFDKYEERSNNSKMSELRDVDISCRDILTSSDSQNDASQRHINSLRELQAQDALTRRDLGVNAYTMTLGEPEDMELEWENHERMKDDLQQLLEEANCGASLHGHDAIEGSDGGQSGTMNPSIQATASRLPNSSRADALSVPSQESTQLRPYSKPALVTRSLVQEASLTVRPISQEEGQNAAREATKLLKESTESYLSIEAASEISAHCNSALDGPAYQVLMVTAPTSAQVANTVGNEVYTGPFYGNPNDAPLFPFSYGGKEFKLKTREPTDLPSFKFSSNFTGNSLQAFINDYENVPPKPETIFQLSTLPPSRKQVVEWQQRRAESQRSQDAIPNSIYALPSLPTIGTSDEMSLMCLEVLTVVRKNQTPIAETDSLEAVIWQVGQESGVIALAGPGGALEFEESLEAATPKMSLVLVDSELELIEMLVKTVKKLDPDLLTGYETNSFSWGYVAERYTQLTDDILDIGRLKPGNSFTRVDPILHPGRYLINLWYILRHEINLPKYTLEVAIQHTFHHTTPHYSFDTLYGWWTSLKRSKVIKYLASRVRLTLKLIDHLEMISKFSEQARIIGVDFYSCMTRGSQFKVESVLCRLSKRRNFRLISPSRQQVAQQAALERIPLVMEPESNLYTDPVCVLDFRSLYPSIIIAFNLCFSTCIGRLQPWKGKNKLGVLEDLPIPAGLSQNDVFIAPNGIGFVKPHVRRSVLATMLTEILESRFMIKNSMKLKKSDLRYQRNMNSKQLALKFIANVTYGYVSASFSGRMPCAEIADTIVSTGRELLVKSIAIIESQKQWGITPKVVYGDTDSLFVRLPGVSKTQAFVIGNELARIVTASFPSPIELEMEKVYKPCILLTKKRYVGLSYDSPNAGAKFDAKGTETIRRDGTPIESRLERGALDLLFEDCDLSKVKAYLQNEWRRILDGTVNLKEFCFSQQVKLGHYRANASNLPPGAVVSLKKAAVDKGSVPQYNERVSYIIKNGLGNINERAVAPEEIVEDPYMTIDSQYYILKNIIPPLERLFNIFGADVRGWYTEMPKTNKTSNRHMYKAQCVVCHGRSDTPLCGLCRVNEAESLHVLQYRENSQQQALKSWEEMCTDCSGDKMGCRFCTSQDCAIYYDRERARGELKELSKETQQAEAYIENLENLEF